MLIVILMEKHNHQVLTDSMVCSKLDISRYKLGQYINGINLVLEDNELSINREGILEYSPILTTTLEILKNIYIQRSQKFKLVQYIVNGGDNINFFAKKEYMSLPQAYRKRAELAIFLKDELGIKLRGMDFIGDSELKIRNSLFDLYYFYFSGFELPFSQKILVKCLEIKNIVLSTCANRIPKTQEKRLRLFICIQLTRVLAKRKISKQDTDLIHNIVSIKNLEHYSSKKLSEIGLSQNEQVVLLVNIQLSIQKNDISIVETSPINELIFNFKQVLKRYISPNIYEENNLLEESALLFANWLIFSNKATSFVEEAQIGYFSEMYPTFHAISFQFVDENCRILLGSEIDNGQLAKYYYDIIFSLIQKISLDDVEPVINIFVDFSHGNSYNMFIKRNIENYKDLNVCLQDFYDSTTDLYLTDVYLQNIRTQKIIWRDPPTVNDWANFGDQVLTIKERKRKHEKK